MRQILFAAVLAMVAGPALAAAPSFSANQIVAVATGDINRDGKPDAVMLIAPGKQSTSDNGLLVLPGDGFEGTVRYDEFVPNFVWGDTMAGRQPSIRIDERGSVLVSSHNESIGRDRWTKVLTLAWRGSGLVVAGYTYQDYDTLDPNKHSSCDLNLLTGRGTKDVNGRKMTLVIGPARIPVANWPGGAHENPCGFNW